MSTINPRHRAEGRRVVFRDDANNRSVTIATTFSPDWARRIADALNQTDPLLSGWKK